MVQIDVEVEEVWIFHIYVWKKIQPKSQIGLLFENSHALLVEIRFINIIYYEYSDGVEINHFLMLDAFVFLLQG